MKKQALILLSFLTIGAFSSQSQIKFLSEGKEVTEYNPEMDDLKVVFDIPEKASEYEEILFGVEDYTNANRFNPEFSKERFYPSGQFNDKKPHEMWIMKPNKEMGDFCSSSYGGISCYSPFSKVNSIARDYESVELNVRIAGRNIMRYEFNDEGEKVPVYKTVVLEMTKIKLNFGPVIMELESNTGAFIVNKYKGLNYSRLVEANTGEMIDAYYNSSDESNEIRFRVTRLEKGTNNNPVFDMSGGGGPKTTDDEVTVESTKNSIAVELMRQSVPSAFKFIEEVPAGYYWNSSKEIAYEPFLMAKNADKRNNVENHFSKVKSSLQWKKGKIGSLNCQITEIEVYTRNQINNNNGSVTIKEGEHGKTIPMLFFVGEKNGQIIAGSMHSEGLKTITEDETTFWNFMIDKGIQ